MKSVFKLANWFYRALKGQSNILSMPEGLPPRPAEAEAFAVMAAEEVGGNAADFFQRARSIRDLASWVLSSGIIQESTPVWDVMHHIIREATGALNWSRATLIAGYIKLYFQISHHCLTRAPEGEPLRPVEEETLVEAKREGGHATLSLHALVYDALQLDY
ncbi:hypothetical protein TSUD_39590 [Trifolium subterraneum]|uniref:Uncharacterized protein n=1 Tax=Trifolium subterraneum TaxID=3900 RepID=A0A2Z6NHU6_TRISU|nr:hypothetical protein TSUD_39590 [Trifolium subterraneum]